MERWKGKDKTGKAEHSSHFHCLMVLPPRGAAWWSVPKLQSKVKCPKSKV